MAPIFPSLAAPFALLSLLVPSPSSHHQLPICLIGQIFVHHKTEHRTAPIVWQHQLCSTRREVLHRDYGSSSHLGPRNHAYGGIEHPTADNFVRFGCVGRDSIIRLVLRNASTNNVAYLAFNDVSFDGDSRSHRIFIIVERTP